MGRETERETEHGQQTVLFEIVNGNALQACSLKTDFPTRYWIRAISPCWRACKYQENLTAACRSSHDSDRVITGTTRCLGTIPVVAGSLSAATFPRIIRISCTRLPECHP